MENNLEKNEFFAQYWGQKVMYYYSPDNEKLYQEDISHYINISGIKHCHLLLKPLSAISDKDAIEVAMMFYRYSSKSSEEKLIQEGKSIVTCIIHLSNENFGTNRSFYSYQRVIDFLRSKSYALPFRKLSVEQLIEKGYIRLAETTSK